MSKILTDLEMIDIIRRAPEEIDCGDQYRAFLEGLGDLICDHFGGTRGVGEFIHDRYYCAFGINECVPDNGGVFQAYDPDVSWYRGREAEVVPAVGPELEAGGGRDE